MARMPQIPAPEIGNRPDSRVGRAESPDIEAVTQPFQMGASAAENAADHLERLQQQRDQATAKLQKVADSVTATKMAGDHSEKLRNLATQLQTQFWDTPEKFPDEFRRQSQALTDSEIKGAPSQQVAMDLAEKNATIDNQHLSLAHSWSIGRTAQLAKSQFTELASSQVRAAQSATTLPGLTVAISTAEKTLAPLAKDIHANPEMAVDKLKHDMAAAWVEANGPNNPAGVGSALGQKDGPLSLLTPKEQAEYQRKAGGEWLKGYGERERFNVIKEAADHGSKVYDLFLNGQLDSKNTFQMKAALDAKMDAISKNPQYDKNPEEKAHQVKVVQTQLDTLRYLSEAAQKGGHFDAAFDQAKQTKLFNDLAALGKPGDKTPKDLLKVVELRHDLAEAQFSRSISDARAATMNKALTQMTGKALTKEASNTWHLPTLNDFSFRSPRQAGNAALNAHFESGAFGKLTDEQKNNARMDYLSQIVDATENGRNVDTKSAEQMAFEAMKHAAGRVGGR